MSNFEIINSGEINIKNDITNDNNEEMIVTGAIYTKNESKIIFSSINNNNGSLFLYNVNKNIIENQSISNYKNLIDSVQYNINNAVSNYINKSVKFITQVDDNYIYTIPNDSNDILYFKYGVNKCGYIRI